MKYILFIKEYRIIKKMTQYELAKKCRINQSYISQLESNHPRAKSPTLRTMFRIAKALDICPHILVQYNFKCDHDCFTNCDKKT